MVKRHLTLAAASAVSMLIGCNGKVTEARRPAPVEIQPTEVDESAAQQADASSSDSATLLAKKTEEFARNIEQQMTQRPPRNVQPSSVEWIDAGDFSLIPSSMRSWSTSEPARDVTVQPVARQMNKDSAEPVQGPGNPRVNVESNTPLQIADSSSTSLTASPTGNGAPEAIAPISPVTAEQLAGRITQQVKDYPRDVSAHLKYQLLQFIMEERVPSMSALAALPSEDRELIVAVMDGLSNFRNTLRQDSNMLLSRKIRPLLDMSDRLRTQADLHISTVELTTAVRSFGNYDPLDAAKFVAGKDHAAILYCEVQNFSSQVTAEKRWETKLSMEAVLYTENGTQVWSDRADQVTDVSRVRRNDFFVAKRIKLPSTLVIGRYLLKVTVVDQQVNRVAEATLPITIIAQ